MGCVCSSLDGKEDQSYVDRGMTPGSSLGKSDTVSSGKTKGWDGQSCTVTGSGINSQGNRWFTLDYGSGTKNSYHYQNADGSYYFKNPDGSSYFNNGKGVSSYTPAEE